MTMIITSGAPAIEGLVPGAGPPSFDFQQLDEEWRNPYTNIVLVGVDGSYWHLLGSKAGTEGATIAQHLDGFMHAPFTSLFSEGPYQIGGYYERTDYKKRVIKMGVQLQQPNNLETMWQYRNVEQKWWKAWSTNQDGYLGCYTRSHGWRWLRVRLMEETKTPLDLDPAAFDNNFMAWDMVIVALQPFWSRKMLTDTWQNTSATATSWDEIQYMLENLVNQFIGDVLVGHGGTLQPGKDVGSGVLKCPITGDQPQYPKFLVSSPGRCWIEDGGGTGNMLPLPLLQPTDGYMLVDTDPTARTLTCATDPVDPLFLQILSNSQFLDIILNDVIDSGLPVWKRFQYQFQNSLVPGGDGSSYANIKVYHSDQNGTVTMLLPQRFDKPYG